MADDTDDKTEDPTQKRLDDALAKGDVVKSQEVNTWFIIAGGTLASLVTALKDRGRQRADALARLEHLDGLSRAPEWGDGIRDKLRARLTDWRCMLGRQPEIARQILRRLLVGRLVLTPDAQARTYAVQGRASYGRLLEGLISVVGLVAPG